MSARDLTAIERAAIDYAIDEAVAEGIVDGHYIFNPETDMVALASVASEEFKADAVAAYARLLRGDR